MDAPLPSAASMSQNGCGIFDNHSPRGGESHGTAYDNAVPVHLAGMVPSKTVRSKQSSLGHSVFTKDLVVQFDPQAWLVRWCRHVAVGKDLDRFFNQIVP
jgi:hypothetical protein